MSDPAPALRRKSYAVPVAAGLASSFLFLSVFLTFAFLLPVQIAFGRKGGRGGMAAVGISAAGIALAQGARFAMAGARVGEVGALAGLGALAAGILPPLVLLGSLALINAPLGLRWAPILKILGATALCALAATPVFISIGNNASIAAYMESEIGAILAPLRNAAAGASEGYEASALAASLDPKDLVAASLALLRNSFAVVVFFMLAGSWWLGNRMSGLGSMGRERSVALEELRLPYSFLWAFLVSWSIVLAAVLLRAPAAVSAFAWNSALVVSLAYSAVGLGIVSYLLKSWNTPKSLRAVLAIMAVLSLATPLGIAVVALLPLIGVTEIWIHYRKPKGVGA